MGGRPKAPIAVVDRTIQLLQHLGGSDKGECGMTEVAHALGLPKATAYRILASLAAHRFVEKNPDTGRYRLSWGIFEVGNKVPGVIHLKSVARSEMARLSQLCHETVNLAVRSGTDAVLIDKIDSDQLLRLDLEVGRREPLHATALGKALLSDDSRESLEALFGRKDLLPLTPRTLTDLDDLAAALEEVSARGYSTDDEEFAPNVRCVGAPIRDHSARIVAALSVSGPANQFTLERSREVAPHVVSTAERISSALGFRREMDRRSVHA